MKKDCYSQNLVDAQKFRECARCPLFDECTQTVTLQGGAKAALVGQALGTVLGVAGLALALLRWSDMPNGAPWLAFVVLVYLVAVFRAGRDYRLSNREEREHLARLAESKPEGGGPAGSGHHAAPAHH